MLIRETGEYNMTEKKSDIIADIRDGKVPSGYSKTWHLMPTDWQDVPLSHVFEKKKKKNKGNIVKTVFTNSAVNGIIPQSEYFEKDIANSENTEGYYVVDPLDYVYNPRISENAPYGPFKRNDTGLTGVVSPLYIVLAPRKEFSESEFLRYYLESAQWHKYAYSIANYGARFDRMNITDDELMQLPIAWPSLTEQNRIAEILKQCDKVIELKQEKINELKHLKKECLRTMFPAKGCNKPKIRFPEFSEAWEQRKLGEISGKVIGGGTPKTSVSEYWDGDIPWIQSSNVQENEMFDFDIPKSITQEGIDKSAAKLVPENSIAVVTHVGVGKLVFVPFSYTTSQDFTSLSELKTDAKFTCYSLYRRIQNDLHVVQGSAIKGITKDDLLSKEIMVPKIEEQKKIGDYFRNLDHLITLHQRELEEQKNNKKALAQLLLTGVTRVSV